MAIHTAETGGTAVYRCNICSLPLPLRLPLPGEVASCWVCQFCDNHFFATLVDDCDPDIISNVRPASDLNPRVMIGPEVLAKLYKRKERMGRGFDERSHGRRAIEFVMTVICDRGEIGVFGVDLSAGGVGFASPWELPVGSQIGVRFDYLPGTPASNCIVRYCTPASPDQFRIGAEFIVRDGDAAKASVGIEARDIASPGAG